MLRQSVQKRGNGPVGVNLSRTGGDFAIPHWDANYACADMVFERFPGALGRPAFYPLNSQCPLERNEDPGSGKGLPDPASHIGFRRPRPHLPANHFPALPAPERRPAGAQPPDKRHHRRRRPQVI